ncbi:MAG: CHC2 zinc finger domain-containing protein, partial [Tissierellia bacterium]|nr:CHC2 zinc finger domain-containing protein [Tissierellia bacterium]
MNAVTKINKYLDINKLLNHYKFNHIKQNGKMIRACCKIHDGNNPTAFVIDSETSLWYCHTNNCGGGDVYDLVEKMENISFKNAVHWLASFFNVDISKCNVIERKNDYLSELNKWIKMMRNQKKIELKKFNIKEEIRLVTKFRNFKLETLQYFNLGYVENVQLNKKNGGIYTL